MTALWLAFLVYFAVMGALGALKAEHGVDLVLGIISATCFAGAAALAWVNR